MKNILKNSIYLNIFVYLSVSCSALNTVEIHKQVKDTSKKVVAVTTASHSKSSFKKNLKLVYSKKHYQFWLDYFTKRERVRFQKHLKNGDKFKGLIHSILKSYNLPTDLYFVGLIESGYNIHAKSRASAVGPWQFMKRTAKYYGMRVDRYVDERRNIIKSTHSAAKYLRDLYNILGSWELAFCAYNAGEYRIINAIKKGKTRDYRKLTQKKLIPKETINYVPKMAAARELAKNRELYGFSYGKADKDFQNIKKIKFTRSFNFKKALSSSNVPSALIKKLNSDIKKNFVKVTKPFELIAPINFKFDTSILNRSSSNLVRVFNPKKKRRFRIHTVKKGEYILKIAKRYGINIRSLIKANNLKSTVLAINQKLRIPLSIKKKRQIYVVKKGDNLFNIAKKFNSTIKRIIAHNQLKTKRIYPKQELYIPMGES